ncbi:MAG: hypothetical protein HY698_13595 [Deltaproteobacteria bacterium]|nr:hypothetical protein [Deltaproteobacteria bacterium]
MRSHSLHQSPHPRRAQRCGLAAGLACLTITCTGEPWPSPDLSAGRAHDERATVLVDRRHVRGSSEFAALVFRPNEGSPDQGTPPSLLISVTPNMHGQSDNVMGSEYFVQPRFRDVTGRVRLPERFLVELPDAQPVTIQLESVRRAPDDGGLEVWTGHLFEPRFLHIPRVENAIFVLDERGSTMNAFWEVDGRAYRILPGASGLHRLIEVPPSPEYLCGSGSPRQVVSVQGPGHGETDECGTTIVDAFIGFSDAAAAQVGNARAEAELLVESVNSGLRNSRVSGIRVRLVGTGTTPTNWGITTACLDAFPGWMRAEIESSGADLAGMVQMPTNAPGSAAGWAGMPGWTEVVGAPWPAAFRHEVGHNVGGGHCRGDFRAPYEYGYGFNSGRFTTHMCGNATNFYSTPDVTDDRGKPLGVAGAQDMARLWRERAKAMSERATHTIPFPDCGGPPPDAGLPPDAKSPDASRVDAATPDAAPADARVPDARVPDAAPPSDPVDASPSPDARRSPDASPANRADASPGGSMDNHLRGGWGCRITRKRDQGGRPANGSLGILVACCVVSRLCQARWRARTTRSPDPQK